MKLYVIGLSMLLTAPVIGHAQSGDILSLVDGLLILINGYIIPFLLSLAVLFFIYNVTRYFVIESGNPEGREKARQFAFYGLLALVFIVAFWGIIIFVIRGFGFDQAISQHCRPVPDYINPLGYECDGDTMPNPHEGIGGGVVVAPPPTEEDTGGNGSPDPADNDAGDTTPLQPGTGGDADTEDDETSLQIRSEIISAGEEFARNRLPGLVGDNADLVEAALLDPLRTSSTNDLDQLQAAYRLWRLDGIDTQQMQAYFDAINADRTAVGFSEITIEQVEDGLALPFPPAFVSTQDTMANNIRAGLETYNTLGTVTPLTDTQIDSLVTASTDPSLPYNDRRDRLYAMLGDNDSGTIYLRDPNDAMAPYDEIEFPFTDNLSTEAFFNADFADMM